jgi:light-regulated signal transduction histidine kinase (bacteriophytochrome)
MSDLQDENAQLKIQVKALNDKIASMLEIAHNLRASVTSVSAYAKLLRKHDSDPAVSEEALDRIETHSTESVRLIELLQ